MEQFDRLVDSLLNEEPIAPAPPPPAAPPEAAPPPPVAPGQGEQPDASPAPANDPLSPAAEVTLVRLLLKALVINLEDSDLGTLEKIDQPEVTPENAEQVKTDVINLINSQATRGENEERVEQVAELNAQINEKNRKRALHKIISTMKNYSDVDINT